MKDGGLFDRIQWKINGINFISSLIVMVFFYDATLDLGYYRLFGDLYQTSGFIPFWFIMSLAISLPFTIVGIFKKLNDYGRISLDGLFESTQHSSKSIEGKIEL